MRDNLFFKSTIILLIGGALTKFLGFFIRIIITRTIGIEGISLYSLLMPTYSLLTTIAILSYPISVSKFIAENKYKSKNIILSIIPISIIINLITLLLVYLSAPIISVSLLKEERLFYPLLACALTLPFISLSSITKGYFWGKQNMFPYMVSNVCEQIIRLCFFIILLPLIINKGVVFTIFIIIIFNIVSESFSIFVMSLFLPKNTKIKISDFKINKLILKDIYGLSIPSTSSKIVGSICYFLEPIILTNVLLFIGYSKDFILTEYGIINGYALSLLMIPQFFVGSISTSLIPEISKLYKKKNYNLCFKRVKQIMIISLSIGLLFTMVIYIKPEFFLNLIFKTNLGVNYIKILSPFMLLHFIDMPIISALQALNKSKTNMIITLIGSVIKLSVIALFSLLKIGMYSLIIAIIINIIIQTFLNYRVLKKALMIN